jgi:regulator of protease activity HflC (stomatin/prohibitin superfamily)
MKGFISLVVVGFIGFIVWLLFLGEKVEIPAAHVGKIMTKDGYQETLLPPSKFRLPSCITYCDRLVLLDASDRTFDEHLEIFIPKDKLILKATVRTTLSINPKRTEELFTSISPLKDEANPEYVSKIPLNSIYLTYGNQIVQMEAREYLSQFSIGEIASSMEQINSELNARLSKALSERSPFTVRSVGITKVEYPKLITDAQEDAAERREKIQQEEAQLQISKVTLERELQEARLRRQIEKEKAETAAEGQRIQALTIDPRVLELRKIENERAWIEKWDGRQPTTVLGEAMQLYTHTAK